MTNNVNSWSYPFAGGDSNPLANLTSLAKARGGFYPMGANGLWHGGVHFDQGTAGAFDQSSVRCIADGEVIAYRIDDEYPISEYTGEVPLIKRAPFSTGFVLVKHRLALPPLGTSSASAASVPVLTVYSLYMHLQDRAGYQAKPDLPRPAFWGEGIYSVETQGSDLNVRAEASQSASILAVLPKGTRVKIGAGSGDFRKLLSIVSGTAVPALAPADGEGTLPGFLAFKFLKAHSEPKAKGSVVVLDSPVPIKAGDLIGHLGRYQNLNEGSPQPLLHLEVFSCEDVPAFIARSRAHAARLPEAQKTLLKVHKGASKLIPHREGIDANNPPRISDEGVTVGVDLILPQSLLDSLPADAKLVVPASTGGMSCSPETRWWRLDNLLADTGGQPISGWLAEQEMITTRHSPWEWQGYDFIEDRERPAGALAYHLEALRRLIDSERASYQGMIDQSDKGPVKQRLYAILDGNGDQKITPEEIRTALGKPWHAQSIAQLITKHESEWLWNPAKWDELDELMEHSPADPNPDWAEEKKRIEKLSWWKELGGKHGIAADGVVWHFQPLGLIGNLSKIEDHPVIFINNKKTELRFLSLFGGATIDDEDYVIAANELGCEVEAIKAVAITETGSIGSYFIKEGDDIVPSILFERHYFHILTDGVYDASHPDVSNPSRGGYGRFGSQYNKLIEAYKLNSSAALRSASWGKFQIMGRYHQNAGYASVEEFVNDLSVSEKNHLKAFVNFIKSDSRLAKAIIEKNWLAFAKAYNGPAQQGYDRKMEANYNALKSN
ncbi:hypothetical protein D3C84_414890 [compost metagenome]